MIRILPDSALKELLLLWFLSLLALLTLAIRLWEQSTIAVGRRFLPLHHCWTGRQKCLSPDEQLVYCTACSACLNSEFWKSSYWDFLQSSLYLLLREIAVEMKSKNLKESRSYHTVFALTLWDRVSFGLEEQLCSSCFMVKTAMVRIFSVTAHWPSFSVSLLRR